MRKAKTMMRPVVAAIVSESFGALQSASSILLLFLLLPDLILILMSSLSVSLSDSLAAAER